MAAILTYESVAAKGHARPLRIVSFENDLDSLRLAFKHHDRFPYLRHGGPPAILERAVWQSKQYGGLEWKLIEGDFLATMRLAEPPDLIFYDMFSGKTCAPAWTIEAFRAVNAVCAGRDVELFTYTCSTASRVAMLGAGFHVARGRNAGDKEETTIAFTCLDKGRERERDILGAEWLKKWERSSAKFPAFLEGSDHASFEQAIRSRPQFQTNAGFK